MKPEDDPALVKETTLPDSSISILLVEDNPGDVFIIKDLLVHSGEKFSITHSSRLTDTLNLLKSHHFDAILLDLGLPDSFGMETLDKLKISNFTAPVIILTGLDDEMSALAAVKQGAQEYLVKGKLTSENILHAVRYSIERKKVQELEKKQTWQFSILSSATTAINECEENISTYKVVCSSIKKLLGKCIVVAVETRSQDTAHIVESVGLEAYLEKVENITGNPLTETTYKLETEPHIVRIYRTGRLEKINSFYTFSTGSYSKEVFEKVEAYLPFKNKYAIGFSRNENFYGGLTIVSEDEILDEDRKIIETLCSQASLNIHRRSIENDLRLSEKKYKELNEELENKVEERTKELADVNSALSWELDDRRIVMEILRQGEERYRNLVELSPNAVLVNRSNKIVLVNPAALRLFGATDEAQIIGKSPYDLFHPDCHSMISERLMNLMKGRSVPPKEEKIVRIDGSIRDVEVVAALTADAEGSAIQVLLRDITERKRIEKEQQTTIKFLHLVNNSRGTKNLVQSAAKFFQEQSGCEAVGIRLKKDEDYPYIESLGFSKDFLLTENKLCSVNRNGAKTYDCLCGNVICGRFDPSRPFYTRFGSFWTNSTTELNKSYSEADLMTNPRNRCNFEGFESVAIIPLHAGKEQIGLLQLNDKKRDVFTKETIGFWERLSGYLAVALVKFITEEALLESEERYRSLVESSPDAVIVVHEDKFIYANSVALKMYNAKSLEHLQTKTALELVHPDDRSLIKTQVRWRKGQNKVAMHEIRIFTLDGGSIPVESTGSRINIQSKPSIQFIFRDITERKKRERELRKLNQTLIALDKCSQALVRASDEETYLSNVCSIIADDCHYSMIWIGYAQDDQEKSVKPVAYAGFNGGYLESLKVTWANNEYGKGPTGTAIRTGKVSICHDMQNDPCYKPWRQNAMKRGYASSISIPLIESERTFGALTIYSKEQDPFSEDEVNLLSELANDLSYGITAIRWREAQAKAEEQLRKYAADLQELNATKDKFFGIIAHDLKNPFASLLGTSELLSQNPDKYSGDTIKKFAEIIYHASKSAYSLLENLLEWSRSQTGNLRYDPQSLEVEDLITRNISNLEGIAANKQIELSFDVPVDLKVTADKNMLNTILRNLLSNAIKFTHKHGKIVVKATKQTNAVKFTVKDTGVGIPKDEIGKLFRLDAKYMTIGTDSERGTGLGLILCKEFVEKHGGKIYVESEQDHGSEFIFTIPD